MQLHYLWTHTHPGEIFVSPGTVPLFIYQSVVKLNHSEAPDTLIRWCSESKLRRVFFVLKRSTNTDATGICFIDLLSGPDQGSPVGIHVTQHCRNRGSSAAQTDQRTMTWETQSLTLPLIRSDWIKRRSFSSRLAFPDNWQLRDTDHVKPI